MKLMPRREYFLLIISVIAICTIIELILRLCGYVPGQYIYRGIQRVDSVYLLKGMTADENGVFKVSGETRFEIAQAIQKSLANKRWDYSYDYKTVSSEEYDLVNDFVSVQRGKYENRFSMFLD